MNTNNNEETHIKPQLGILGSITDDEGEFFSPVPTKPKIDEYRMTTEILKKDEFNDLIHGPNDIIKLYNAAKKIKNLGSGATSQGEIIKLADSDKLYIIKRTNFNMEINKPHKILSKIRNQLINEQLIYQMLERDPEYKNYISCLLYADVPLISHYTPEYNYSYFIFEYREGVTLEEFINILIKNNKTLSYEEIMILITNIGNALQFIHKNGVIHRDLKPDNIFIDFTRNNIPLLFDFDISCRSGVDCKMAEFIGTEKYATNGAKKIRRKTDILTFDTYTYSENSDRYALVRIMEEDLIRIINPEDIVKLKGQIGLLQPLKLLGGNKMKRNKTRKVGGKCRIGLLNPWWGGKKRTIKGGSGCGCGISKQPVLQLPSGISLAPLTKSLKGGGCGCQTLPKLPISMGGYRPTKKNLKYLKLWKKGKSIGFTMKSSLKAKGLIPRSDGKKRVSPKYR